MILPLYIVNIIIFYINYILGWKMKRVSRRGKSLSLQDTTDDVKVANESIKKDATELVKTPDEQQKEQEQKFFEGSLI